MKALFIGGTGTISMAITRAVAAKPEWELYLVNRGNRADRIPENVHLICCDANDEKALAEKLQGMSFDCVCDFIGFEPEQVQRDWRIFAGKTRQYMYISSASAYNKPCRSPIISEKTSLANPYWEYSRKKIACERFLMDKYEQEGFPVTIIRPSHTYDDRKIAVGIHGKKGSWQIVRRMLEGKPVLIHGDGNSLWTLTYNEDFAKGFVGLMGNPRAIGEAFGITSDEVLTWNQIYEAIAAAVGAELKPCYVPSSFLAQVGTQYDLRGALLGDKANNMVFDTSKLKAAVPDFVCTTRFDQGVRKAIRYHLEHPELQTEDPEFDAFCDRVVEAMETAQKLAMQ